MINLALDNTLSPRKYLFLITWPIFIEVFLQMLMNLTDVFMISFISDEAVAAIGVVNQLMHFTFVLFNFTAMGSGVVVSQYVGANNPKGIRKTITHALILNLIFGLVISLFVGLNRHFLLNLFSLEPSLYAYAESYTLIVGLALFAQAMILTVSSILQAMGFTKDVMVTVLLMNVLNVIGNYVFIFGAGFIPQLGVPGVAIATAGSRLIIMLWLFIVLFKRIDIKMKWRDFFNLEKEYASKILGIGIPSAGEQMSYKLSQIIVTMMITTLGATALATRVYSQNLMSVLTIIAVSMSKGCKFL
ncbi:MATE family efflux transporter [Alkalibacterium sp. MB6]|uniref:MATE family efflux transporter n=1 Tax=Alkalibacterium sp. MB6 TaxID=2081965 RepID=UPI00192A1790|nr:MATE family efflux transporter [Alkalibacterium sp. MB6]